MKPRHEKNSNRFASVRGYAGFLILLSAPFLMGAGEKDRTDVEKNRQQIQEMTSEQQAKLKRNFAEYQKLSVKDQNVIRKLHQRLEEDANNGGNLRELMWVYKEWLKTLSPWQREDLLKQKDPVARMGLVRKFKRRQDYDELEPTLSRTKKEQWQKADDVTREKLIKEFKRDPETMSRRSSYGSSRRGPRSPFFTTVEFDKVMNLVEKDTEIDQSIRAQFPDIKKVERHLLVLLAALKQSQKQQNAQTGKQPNPQSPRAVPVRWPDDELMKQIMDFLENSKLENAEFQKRLQSSESQESRRRSLFFSIKVSFHSEWWAELTKHSPSDEELEKFFKQLDQSDKENLLHLSRSEQSRSLKNRYLFHQAKQAKFHDEYSELWKISSRYHRPGPRGGRSRGGRSRGNGDRGRKRGGPKGEFGPGKGPQFPPGNKEIRKGSPRG